MKNPRFSIFILLSLAFITACTTTRPTAVTKTTTTPPPPLVQREFRAAWVATVANINWPSKPGVPVEQQKQEAIALLDLLESHNFNAVIFQVRPQTDALYKSELEPWSYYLTGEQGKAPEPFYDPLEFWIKEAHDRGLELHVWLNPYRAHHKAGGPVTDASIIKKRPELALELKQGYWWLDPGKAGTREHSLAVVTDLVRRYDLDGVHFDDYFYPYPDYNDFEDFPDDESWQSYQTAGGKLSRGDWRRENVNVFIKQVYENIKEIKPHVKFGLSPFGIWRPGYPPSISGYDQYEKLYADARLWLNEGWIDYFTPQLYWPTNQIPQSFPVLLGWWEGENKQGRHLWPGISIGRLKGEQAIDETINQIMITRGMLPESPGIVHWSIGPLVSSPELVTAIAEGPYREKALVPRSPWLDATPPKRPEVTTSVQEDKLEIGWSHSDEKDVFRWVVHYRYGNNWEYEVMHHNDRFLEIDLFRVDQKLLEEKGTDAEGLLTPLKEIAVTAVDRMGNESAPMQVALEKFTYQFSVQPDGTVQLNEPLIEFRRAPSDTTHEQSFSVLCKSKFPGQAFINGEKVKMYGTGIFFRQVTFQEGWNTVHAEVIGEDAPVAVAEKKVYYQPANLSRKPFPLWIDDASVSPAIDQVLLSSDVVQISLKGSKGQTAWARIRPGKLKIPLLREDFDDYSIYEGELVLAELKKGKSYSVELVFEPAITKGQTIKVQAPGSIMVQDAAEFPLVETTQPNTILSYNLGPIRLGGPIIAEYGPGIVLQTNGRIGDYFRIFLDDGKTGMMHQEQVKMLPTGQQKPSYFIQYAGAAPAEDMDVVNIPWSEPVPYAVFPEPEHKRIRIALYGAHTSSTWISHRRGLKVVDNVTWQQPSAGTYELIINLQTDRIWGYELVTEDKTLQLRVKHPPVLEADGQRRPLKGLTVSIEAGHGGHNHGATGLSGLLEKDVNLDVALRLEKICRESGVEVVQVRPDDRYMKLSEKRDIVEASGSHLHVSIHANSANPRGDYLRVGGVSTYYHNPFWADFAELMYDELLELPLEEFGVVGSFNYLVTRMSSRPSILVEQAFLSHAGDEEKLANPEFRQQMAEKIFEGIVRYVGYMHGT